MVNDGRRSGISFNFLLYLHFELLIFTGSASFLVFTKKESSLDSSSA